MENTFWIAFGASTLAAVVTSIGIFVIRRFKSWDNKNAIYFICFAGGILISVSFLYLIPLISIGFHSFIDGFIYSIIITDSIFICLLAAIGMVLQEFPEGIITYLLLIRSGFKEKTSYSLPL